MTQAAWLQRYREGSYRSAKFYMDSHSLTFGRRKVVHEFPGRDDAEVEDLGMLDDRFSMNVYILADDYFNDRDTFVQEIKEHKNGLLVHPYAGSYQVQILSASYSETWDEGRMVRFKIEAIQDADQDVTIQILDTKTNLLEKRKTMLEAINEFFEEVYTVTEAPYAVFNEIVAGIDSGIEVIDTAKQSVNSAAGYQAELSRILGRVEYLALNGSDLAKDIQSLISFGIDIADVFIEPIEALTSNTGSRKQFSEMTSIANQYNTAIDLDDPISISNNMYLQNAIANMSGLLATVEYESIEDAENIQAILFPFLDALELDPSLSSELKGAVRDVREAIFFDTERRTDGLGTTYTYNIQDQSLPSLVIANAIYGSIDNEQNIINRNTIESPMFISNSITAVVNNE